MATREELERLSSKELHDRAMRLAERRLDIKFIWDLLRELPVAEAATGNLERAEEDINPTSWAAYAPVMLVHDLFRTDEGRLADSLRPVYVDYLLKHEK